VALDRAGERDGADSGIGGAVSAGYKLISWTPYKKRYDAVMLASVVTFIGAFFAISKLVYRGEHAISDEILLMRALGTCATVMLHVILCIGPLARLNPQFLPLLYNRRHLGVTMFFVALAHAVIAVGFYHGFGRISAFYSLFTSNTQYRSLSAFPFETLGLLALIILFAMAATSHDFWLNTLSPRVWKSLHMCVYLAWVLLIGHVALGAMQSERSIAYPTMLFAGVFVVSTLHIVAGRRETRREMRAKPTSGWVDACAVDDIDDSCGKVVGLRNRERVAIFRYGDQYSAISNVCAHQGGPLGEGRIIDGCATCPWHGYQYRPGDGCAPPPFTEKLPTYAIRVENGRVLVNPEPVPPGTHVEPATVREVTYA
jgi:nitrite reductase/ring-hydroxylating ferredoxin subunit/DMSO/TMAO reductase YedYZ heme-binding membrane subunit